MAPWKKKCLKLGLEMQAGFYQEERKAYQEFYAKAGQWDTNFGKGELPGVPGAVSPNVYTYQNHLEGLLKQIAGHHPQNL